MWIRINNLSVSSCADFLNIKKSEFEKLQIPADWHYINRYKVSCRYWYEFKIIVFKESKEYREFMKSLPLKRKDEIASLIRKNKEKRKKDLAFAELEKKIKEQTKEVILKQKEKFDEILLRSKSLIKTSNNKKILITWSIWVWKTYYVFNNLVNIYKKILYVTPTRSLWTELYLKYKKLIQLGISNGEVNISNKKSKVDIIVYEGLQNINILKYDCIVIDEIHYIIDPVRWTNILETIVKTAKENIDIYWLTSTITFDFEKLWFKKEIIFWKSDLTKTFYKWIPSDDILKKHYFIYFCNSYKSSEQENNRYTNKELYTKNDYKILEEFNEKYDCDFTITMPFHSWINPKDRILIQYAFYKWIIKWVFATDILAQGNNFPASLVYIPHLDFKGDKHSDYHFLQMVWRAGRYWFSDEAIIFTEWGRIIDKEVSIQNTELKFNISPPTIIPIYREDTKKEVEILTYINNEILKQFVTWNGSDWDNLRDILFWEIDLEEVDFWRYFDYNYWYKALRYELDLLLYIFDLKVSDKIRNNINNALRLYERRYSPIDLLQDKDFSF